MKVNRKSTPKMVARPYHSEFERLENQERNRERFKLTIGLLAALIVTVLLIEVK